MFQSLPYKLISGGLGILLVLSLGWNVKQGFEARDLRTAVKTLDGQINNPETGYVARLGTCRSNNNTLSAALDRQSASIAANAARGAAAIADATRSVATAQVATADAQRQAAEILRTNPQGGSVCERVLDVDRRILESLQ